MGVPILNVLYFIFPILIFGQDIDKYHTWNEFTKEYKKFLTKDVYIEDEFIFCSVQLRDPDMSPKELRNYKSKLRLDALEKISDYIYSDWLLNIRWKKSLIDRSLLVSAIKDISYFNYRISTEGLQTIFFKREEIIINSAYKLDIHSINIMSGADIITDQEIVSILGKAAKANPNKKSYINWLNNKLSKKVTND